MTSRTKTPPPKRADCRPTPKPKRKRSLAALVHEYQEIYARELAAALSKYKRLKSIEDAIRHATGSVGKVPNHQRRVGREVLTRASNRLLRRRKKLEACETFAELIELVETATGDIDRFGVLAVYDTSLRLGAWFGLSPEIVHLHAGTRKGAKNLGLDVSWGYLDMDELPKPLQTLTAHDAENFLCIYKDQFGS